MTEQEPTTPAAPAATPVTTPAPAATTTTPEPQAGEGSEQMSLDEAKKLRKEAQALRTRLKGYEDAEKQAAETKRLAEEAELGEKERLTKQFQDLQTQYESEKKLRLEITARHDIQKAAEKLNFVYPDLAYSLLKESDLEYDDVGNITNAEDLLKNVLKNRPKLTEEQQPAQTATQKTPPATPPMNPGGRAAIPSPNQAPQGNKPQIPSWDQAFQTGKQ